MLTKVTNGTGESTVNQSTYWLIQICIYALLQRTVTKVS